MAGPLGKTLEFAAADVIPIFTLNRNSSPPANKSLRAKVALVYPYSSSNGTAGLLLAEADFRTRRNGGQVHIRLQGPAARAVGTSRIGIGDTVSLSLDGASWVEDVNASRTPGKSVGAALAFVRKLQLQHSSDGANFSSLLVNESETRHSDITPPASPRTYTHAPPLAPSSRVNIWPSPAFMHHKTDVEQPLPGPIQYRFAEDDPNLDERPRKKTKFWRSSGDWLFSEQPPSPREERASMDMDLSMLLSGDNVQLDDTRLLTEQDRLPSPTRRLTEQARLPSPTGDTPHHVAAQDTDMVVDTLSELRNRDRSPSDMVLPKSSEGPGQAPLEGFRETSTSETQAQTSREGVSAFQMLASQNENELPIISGTPKLMSDPEAHEGTALTPRRWTPALQHIDTVMSLLGDSTDSPKLVTPPSPALQAVDSALLPLISPFPTNTAHESIRMHPETGWDSLTKAQKQTPSYHNLFGLDGSSESRPLTKNHTARATSSLAIVGCDVDQDEFSAVEAQDSSPFSPQSLQPDIPITTGGEVVATQHSMDSIATAHYESTHGTDVSLSDEPAQITSEELQLQCELLSDYHDAEENVLLDAQALPLPANVEKIQHDVSMEEITTLELERVNSKVSQAMMSNSPGLVDFLLPDESTRLLRTETLGISAASQSFLTTQFTEIPQSSTLSVVAEASIRPIAETESIDGSPDGTGPVEDPKSIEMSESVPLAETLPVVGMNRIQWKPESGQRVLASSGLEGNPIIQISQASASAILLPETNVVGIMDIALEENHVPDVESQERSDVEDRFETTTQRQTTDDMDTRLAYAAINAANRLFEGTQNLSVSTQTIDTNESSMHNVAEALKVFTQPGPLSVSSPTANVDRSELASEGVTDSQLHGPTFPTLVSNEGQSHMAEDRDLVLENLLFSSSAAFQIIPDGLQPNTEFFESDYASQFAMNHFMGGEENYRIDNLMHGSDAFVFNSALMDAPDGMYNHGSVPPEPALLHSGTPVDMLTGADPPSAGVDVSLTASTVSFENTTESREDFRKSLALSTPARDIIGAPVGRPLDITPLPFPITTLHVNGNDMQADIQLQPVQKTVSQSPVQATPIEEREVAVPAQSLILETYEANKEVESLAVHSQDVPATPMPRRRSLRSGKRDFTSKLAPSSSEPRTADQAANPEIGLSSETKVSSTEEARSGQKQGHIETRSVEMATPRRMSARLRKSDVPEVLSGWFESRRSTMSHLVDVVNEAVEDEAADIAFPKPPAMMEQNSVADKNLLTQSTRTNSMSRAKDSSLREEQCESSRTLHDESLSKDPTALLISGLQTPLSFYHPLSTLTEYLNNPSPTGETTVDILAVVSWQSKKPLRAKSGPKDFYTILHVVDPSKCGKETEVHVFRPTKDCLPVADKGDAILLRNFIIKSRKRETYLLSGESSAWHVWRASLLQKESTEGDMPLWASKKGGTSISPMEESRGAPVELGSEEQEHARKLHNWWEMIRSQAK